MATLKRVRRVVCCRHGDLKLLLEYKLNVDKLTVDELTVDELTVDELTVDELTLDDLTWYLKSDL